ncbi:MAG TPA: transglycosylase SLT domain-containing protein [Syntrophales bacterium]|nr:transglycosylase SLT domain-containing protein [Syntrophales bacterium]
MKLLHLVSLEGSGKKALIKSSLRILIFIVCLILLERTPAWGDLPLILEPPSSDSMISSLNIKGPLNFCGEPVPLDNQEVRERFEKELLVTLWNRPQIILWMKRSGRFMPFIEEILKQNNMPEDLKYLAIVESSLISHVSSSKGAKGYWQFMEDTGKRYGLKVDSDIDERRNFFSSTRAAISYLKKLYGDFGSWTLAAAAYNMGEEGLKTEIMVQKENTYYNLYLPVETQQYIFRAISAKVILSNPEKYGFKLTKEDIYLPLQFEYVELMCDQDTPISIVAQAAKTYFKVIRDLNPEIRGHYLVKGRHVILIPMGAAEGFQTRFEDLFKKWLAERKEHTYVVKKGETLTSIAAHFNVPVQAILIWNNLGAKKHVKPGDRLFVFPGEGEKK